MFWETADDDNPGYVIGKENHRRRSRARSHSMGQENDGFVDIENNNANGVQLKVPSPSEYVP